MPKANASTKVATPDEITDTGEDYGSEGQRDVAEILI